MRKRWLALVIFVAWTATCWSQHYPLYNQYMHNQFVINPAYAGSRDKLSITALMRRQWLGIAGAPATEAIYFHTPLPDARNNFGVSAVLDRIGVTRRNSFNLSYAYRMDVGRKGARLSFGLQGGVATLQNRWQDVDTDLPGDLAFQGNSSPIWVPAVGFGAYLDTRRFYVGISAPYLLEYHSSAFDLFVNANDHLGSARPAMLATGCVIRLNPDLLLRPSLLVKYVRNSPAQLDMNLFLIVKDMVWAGASYRTGGTLVGLLGIQITPQFNLGYSYDYTTTSLRRFNTGSHELMLRYEFGYRMKAMSPRYF